MKLLAGVGLRIPALFIILLLCCALCPPADVYCGVTVYPTEVFVKPPNRSAPLTVSNPSDREIEVWVGFEFTYPVAFDTGSVEFYKPVSGVTTDEENSAVSWLRAIPQRFTLRPRESQVVRIFGTPPQGIRPGEYWSRIVVSGKDRRPVTAVQEERQAKLKMEIITQSIVPFHFRSGGTTTGISILKAEAYASSRKIRLELTLARTGNASFWGRMNARLLSSDGRLVRSKEYRMVVYRTFDYNADFELAGEPPGQYTLELMFDNKHPSLAPEFRIPGTPVVQRVPVVVP